MEKRHVWRPELSQGRYVEITGLLKPRVKELVNDTLELLMGFFCTVFPDIANDVASESWQYFVKNAIPWASYSAPGVIDVECLEYEDDPEFGIHIDIVACIKRTFGEFEGESETAMEWVKILEDLAVWLRNEAEKIDAPTDV